MNAGQLNQRITLQQRVQTRNALNEKVTTWADVVALWAKAAPLRGREYFAAAQIQAEVTTKFTIRHRDGIDATMRVVWGGNYYDILSVIEVDGMKEWIELMCKAGPQDAR